ncbi:unnamed protein product [Pleuronectes platessa]|uniref:Uncharacterized protein n=1 Tax=Pleuronectes platessa TaxID=8262 RepID=A0A9N7YW57_PLEPL|nr:unnamed protein product [Pleuronectes platessa]
MRRLHQTGPSDKDEREQLHQVYQTGQLGVGGGLCRPPANQESLLLGAMLCVASAVATGNPGGNPAGNPGARCPWKDGQQTSIGGWCTGRKLKTVTEPTLIRSLGRGVPSLSS